MTGVLHLDTHAVIWLVKGRTNQFSPVALDHMDHSQLLVSPIVELELDYLHEIGRSRNPGRVVIEHLANTFGLGWSQVPLLDVVRAASSLGWTRDPFDRLIAAQARVDGAQLLTKDSTILSNCSWAIWD